MTAGARHAGDPRAGDAREREVREREVREREVREREVRERGERVRRWPLAVALAAPCVLVPLVTRAQGGAPVAAHVGATPVVPNALPNGPNASPNAPNGITADAPDWPAPLDRRVSLRFQDVALRTALDRLAAAARVRLSYSAETLPLDRSVTAAYDRAPLGAALAALLHGAAVEPIVVGADQVVLAPARATVATATTASMNVRPAAPAQTLGVTVLDHVVVTGSAAGASERALPFALDVVGVRGRGSAAGAASVGTTLAQAIDGAVPGVWVWSQPPTSLLARYGSIRGASSFGLSAPKVYLDGVEAANPLLVTALVPESVERVEVIRGPQGAAFYGADAISGVVNVVLRHDGAADGTRQVDLRTGVGASGSAYANRPALTQDYGIALRTGSGTRSAGLAFAANTMGAYVPGASEQRVLGDAYARRVGTRWALSGTAHADAARASSPVNPLLAAALRADSARRGFAEPADPAQSMWQYTVGGSATRADGDRWTHVITAGANGYRLSGVAVEATAVPSAVDSALRAARGGADRGTVRASSVAHLGGAGPVTGTVTVATDYAVLRDATQTTPADPRESEQRLSPVSNGGSGQSGTTGGQGATPPTNAQNSVGAVSWLQTVGVSTQTTVAWHDALFVTAGLRGERNDGYAAASRYALLPLLGATAVHEWSDVTLKLRTAYGRGLRPARTASRTTSWRATGAATRVPDLSPEEQHGIEGGGDLFLGHAIGLHATAFDQRASGLIQQVPLATGGGVGQGPRHLTYELQNVGVITNRGLELEGSWHEGPLSFDASFTRVESRVRQLAPGYGGDLRPGDRMLEVPARTFGLGTAWSHGAWTTSLGASRAMDWTNYDRVALAQAFTQTLGTVLGTRERDPRELSGTALRAFWRTYPGVTHLRASAARDFAPGLAAFLSGDNLLDRQRGEPDDATVLPGRTFTLGIRARF